VHSFETPMEPLGTLCLTTIRVTHTKSTNEFTRVTSPTKVQQRALELLGVSLLM